jgi:urea carboxylase
VTSPASPPRRILVANRGEIACRIIRTIHDLGLEAVAVYSDADRGAAHARQADQAFRLGPGPAAESYMRIDRVLELALASGADGVHPGYGFLSERADFAASVETAGLTFIGPTPDQLRDFGQKHISRGLAAAAGLPLLAGTGVLRDVDHALAAAADVGYPVMLKTSAGGGGIGMHVCASAGELAEAFASATHLGTSNFGSAAVFLERFLPRARHVEVQVFGDGAGGVVVLGERDCSVQRRHQKVIEEAPAPGLSDATRKRLYEDARALAASVSYRSAGTVEFVVDVDTGEHYFLEVNTRLQVEHGVTELLFGIDLVAWMIDPSLAREGDRAEGHAVEARVYAENPVRDFQPSAGRLHDVALPSSLPGVRCDGWVRAGTEITPFYDPLLLKVVAHGATRAEAIVRLDGALAELRLHGVETNVEHLRAVLADSRFASGHGVTTGLLASLPFAPDAVEVVDGGAHTLVVAWPGRQGLWSVGVPPSGPMDDRSFRLGNRLLGNPEHSAGLECVLLGPTLRFHRPATICLTGADMQARLDDLPVAPWEVVAVSPGAVLRLDRVEGPGARAYLLIRGGLDVPEVLGSRTTFDLGGFGGHAGRALAPGDLLRVGPSPAAALGEPVAEESRPVLVHRWEIGVLPGPQAAPDFLTEDDVELFYASDWGVHYNSARTGVRLIGPRLRWARPDGGDAGLHPSNIHDNAYAVGTVDFTGDMPVILGPDGPSLGGFVCPATLVDNELWKLGQLQAGDTVRFVPPWPSLKKNGWKPTIFLQRTGNLTFRRSGDRHLLVEVGDPVLDLDLRVRVHQLAEWFAAESVPGVVDLTPGIRSLQVQVNGDRLTVEAAAELVRRADAELPAVDDVVLPSRVVHLPLSWDDPAVRRAIDIYMRSVRPDAPWCPSNLEFIRRINGLASIDEVRAIAFAAEYLVYGLGDVYLGAPVATPLDPRHRIVTTKYNPARTWTPENAVGIGGAYMCVYGMEGPGGYQFIGRTTPVWQRWPNPGEQPWLLRFFDRIRFYPVSAEELLDLRGASAAGVWRPEIEQGTLSIAAHHRFLAANSSGIATFRAGQLAAFGAERAAWEAHGEFVVADQAEQRVLAVPDDDLELSVPADATVVTAPLAARVWSVVVQAGDEVEADAALIVLEAMKTETTLRSPVRGTVVEVRSQPGDLVAAGRPLVVVRVA